jgi:hypothetical protein
MSSSSAQTVGSSQYGVASHADAFLIDILVQTVDLKDHRSVLEFCTNGESCNDNQDYARWLGHRPG